MFHRIETKILVLFVVNVILWVSLLGLFFYWVAARSLESQVDNSLKGTATVIASQWDGSLLLPLQPGMEGASVYYSFSERLKLLKQRTGVEDIYIASLNQTNIVSSNSLIRIGQPIPRLDLLQSELTSARKGNVSASKLVIWNEHPYKSALAPIYAGDKVVAVLMVDMSPAYLSYLRSFRNSLILFTGVALLCCVLSARLFARSITTPILRITERVDDIGRARYEQPLQLSGKDELAGLAVSIDAMRKNILDRDAQLKMMLSGIAHEIRNPLGGMKLFAGILEKEQLGENERNYVHKIKSEILNLERLLSEFLDFARPRTLDYEKIQIVDLLSEVQELLQDAQNEKQARWLVEIQPGVVSIVADRGRMKQALLNLYKNAFQAVPVSGQVFSQVRKNGNGVVWDISNTQTIRLSKELEEKIFDPFFTTKEKGIGLGLPMAKRIIEAHGGTLYVRHNEETRITFSVHVPAADAKLKKVE